MDLLLILRDALASSFVGSLLTAIRARQDGSEVAVLVTQEALAALARGSLAWPRELSGQENRWTLADRGAELGVPVSARGEGRQLDARRLTLQARDAGVVLYACPIWVSLLDLDGELPEGLSGLEPAALIDLLRDAKAVIGTL